LGRVHGRERRQRHGQELEPQNQLKRHKKFWRDLDAFVADNVLVGVVTVSFLVDVKKWDAKLQITSLQSLPSETSAKSYALTAEQSKTEDGGLELEFVLSAKPNSGSINIPFSKENITLFYQPPLTEEFKQEDCEIWTETYVKTKNGEESWRPENVVGSYAVYHRSKKNNGYKNGKICHIFRPKLTDAD